MKYFNIFLDSLGGRDFDSLSASLNVRNSTNVGSSFATDFRSGLGNYPYIYILYI